MAFNSERPVTVSTQMAQSTELLPAPTKMGRVNLRLSDLDRSLRFYSGMLGFNVEQADGSARLYVDAPDNPLVELRERPGIEPAPPNAAGLYHFAILLPRRADLARFVKLLIANEIPFGHSDHTVSEAIYFDDPDGIGIEVYADRPRSTWPVDDGVVRFTGDPIDFDDLFREIQGSDSGWYGMPAGTRIGHVHLRVSDLEESLGFYEQLGFALTADYVRGARFVSAGGYHHHLGMNVWQSRSRPLAGNEVAGLDSFTVVVPDQESLAAAARRLSLEQPTEQGFRAQDPSGISFNIVMAD